MYKAIPVFDKETGKPLVVENDITSDLYDAWAVIDTKTGQYYLGSQFTRETATEIARELNKVWRENGTVYP